MLTAGSVVILHVSPGSASLIGKGTLKTHALVALALTAICSHAFAYDWTSKSIQVEKETQAGKWIAYDPIALNQNARLYRDGWTEPTTDLTLKARVIDGKTYINRVLEVSCGARKIFESGFDESVVAMPWSVVIPSPCGVWRYSLVDTAQVKRPALDGRIPKGPAT